MAEKRKRTKGNPSLIIPKGADRRVLQRLHRRGLAALAQQLRVEREALLRATRIRSVALSSVVRVIAPRRREVAEAYKRDREKVRRLLGSQPPVIRDTKPGRLAWTASRRAVSLIGCRQPPYDVDNFVSGENATADRLTGLLSWQNEVTAQGYVNGTSGVGIYYYVQSAGMLVATVTATVSARVFAGAALFGVAMAELSLGAAVMGYEDDTRGIYTVSNDIYAPYVSLLGIETRQIDSQTYQSTVRTPIRIPQQWVLLYGVLFGTVAARGLADAKIDCTMKIEHICVNME